MCWQAVLYFRRALKLNRHYLSAWTLMGHEYVELKNPPAAIGKPKPSCVEVLAPHAQASHQPWVAGKHEAGLSFCLGPLESNSCPSGPVLVCETGGKGKDHASFPRIH
jgi:hypothetical protein